MSDDEKKFTVIQVLYLEDDPYDADLVERILTQDSTMTFELDVVESKQDLAQALKQKDYDLILSDYYLPSCSAMDVLKMYNDGAFDIPVLVVSGAIGDQAAVSVLQAGAIDYVLKDNLSRLPVAIVQAIELHRLLAKQAEWEQLFHTVEKLSHAGFFRHDMDGRCVYFNDRLIEMLGVDRDAFARSSWVSFVSDEQKGTVQELLEAAKISKQPFKCECEIIGKDRDGKWVSVNAQPEFDREGVFKGYAGMMFNISELKETQEKLEYSVNYDALTGLVSREFFTQLLEKAIQRAKRKDTQVAVLFCDVDGFKKINDQYGHAIGDEFLKVVAQELERVVRETDTVCRFGGDEFLTFIEEYGNLKHLNEICRRINQTFDREFTLNGQPVYASMSVGVAIYPKDGESIDALIKHADQALYDAKKLGKNVYQLYSSKNNAELDRFIKIENGLRVALAENQLYLCYQPQISSRDQKIVGIEALCRWTHAELGEISPSEFIVISEQSGLIHALTRWVCDQALTQFKVWQKNHPEIFKNIMLSLNISAVVLSDTKAFEMLVDLVQASGVDPKLVCFEVTETAVMSSSKGAILSLKKANQTGCSNAIDDFGTGHASLGYLKNLPADILKIDSSFVLDIDKNDQSLLIVQAIVRLAQTLGLYVIAEGAETKTQFEAIQKIGCDAVQGFYLAKPMIGEALLEFLTERPSQIVDCPVRIKSLEG